MIGKYSKKILLSAVLFLGLLLFSGCASQKKGVVHQQQTPLVVQILTQNIAQKQLQLRVNITTRAS